ncbi:M23 family metallopeptidase [Candidatus Pacearchaeota archaeon]|nr:M23 family metallopeptidase [Candidatus Pacearchaeota archaeon]
MNRRQFLFSGALAGLSVRTGNFNDLVHLLNSSQDPRVRVLADNDRFTLKAYSDGFRRGDFVVIEAEPKEPLESSTFNYNAITNRNTTRQFTLPKLEKDGKIYTLAGIDAEYPKQVTKLEVILIAKGRNIGNKDSFNIPILDREFKSEYLESANVENVSPSSPEDVESQKRETRILYPSWDGITIANYIQDGFISPRPRCNPESFGSRRFYDGVEKSFHKGTDCRGNVGDLIVAPMSGVVKLTEQDFFYMGDTVVLDHGLGLYTLHAHMGEQLVKLGQYVKIGTSIGRIGKTGRTNGAHLHWQAKLYGGIREAMNMNPMSLEVLNQVFR